MKAGFILAPLIISYIVLQMCMMQMMTTEQMENWLPQTHPGLGYLKQSGRTQELSLLVLMNVKIRTEQEIIRELRWIKEDSYEICSLHSTCHWMINVVLDNDALKQPFEKAMKEASSLYQLRGKVKVLAKVFSGNFNKYIFFQGFVDKMAEYDLLLLKDSDIRINSFSWPTFIEKRGNAIVSQPLRLSPSECTDGKQQWFQIFEACHYKQPDTPKWATNMIEHLIPVQVSVLEQYFMLFDGKFASFYFHLALRSSLISDESDWGVQYSWCGAAKAWDESRPGCSIIPVIAFHENSRQIVKNESYDQSGYITNEKYINDFIMGKWHRSGFEWGNIIGNYKVLNEIEQDCRKLINLNTDNSFDLQACASAAGHFANVATNESYETLQRIEDELENYMSIKLKNDNEPFNVSRDIDMLKKAKSLLQERLCLTR